MDTNAFVVHQVVEALRAGEVGSYSFGKVIVVGHSLGSITTVVYAGSFPGEADGIILTGFLHALDLDFVNTVFLPSFYPAALEPKFAGQFPSFDYLTTLPGTRGGLFYRQPNVDPLVLALDESLKQTTSIGELSNAAAARRRPPCRRVMRRGVPG